MKVQLQNNYCKAIDAEARRKITRLLRYKQVWYVQGKYGRIKKSRFASFVDGRSGFFLAGFLPRVLRKFPELQLQRFPVANNWQFVFPAEFEPEIANDTVFRADQLAAIKCAVDKGRGVIKFATATGKTVIAAGIISCFNTEFISAHFLAHTKEIVGQTYERFKEYGFDAGILTGEKKENLTAAVLCATVQSYTKHVENFGNGHPDIIIVDECHHVRDVKGQYGKLLSALPSPVKIGLTGTLPEGRYGRLCLEGLIGPVIARMSIQEGVDKEILSVPKITLLPVTKLGSVSGLRKYHKIKDKGIVNNAVRNDLIVRTVGDRFAQGKSCLIIVNEIEHGENLIATFKKVGYKNARFLQGGTKSKVRAQAKQQLIAKDCKVVITTNIWNEGVDIPTLNVVVLAFGGKANTRTLQAIGRGLRRTDEKSQVEIIDFLDPYEYLARHLVERLCIYKKEGLL